MFYQLEGNETFSCNSHIFICIPSEPQWKMKDFISYSSLKKAACKRKIEQGSTWTFTRDLPYIAFMLFARVKFARERT